VCDVARLDPGRFVVNVVLRRLVAFPAKFQGFSVRLPLEFPHNCLHGRLDGSFDERLPAPKWHALGKER
jgi:hypothetical protein